MRRRDRDPRPPVEVLGAEEPADAAQRVAIGRQSGGGHGRGVVVGAVVALLIAGVALGGGDDDPDASPAGDEEEPDTSVPDEVDERSSSTTRRPRRTTTTTATTLPAGPVLPSQTGGALVVLGPGRTGTYVDLDTGARQEVSLGMSDYWQVQGVQGGLVTLDHRGAVYQPLPAGEPVELGPAEQVFASARPDRVWLVTGGGFEGESVAEQTAVLTDLRGQGLTEAISIPTCCVMGATDDGIAFTTGGRTYVAEEGGVRPLVDGHVLHVAGNRVVRMRCDDEAVCETELIHLGNGQSTSLGEIADPYRYGQGLIVSPEGKVAIVVYGPTGATLIVHSSEGRELGRVDLRQGNEPVWLPGGHGLAAVGNGLRIERIYDRNSILVSEPIPALDGVLGERLIVIPP